MSSINLTKIPLFLQTDQFRHVKDELTYQAHGQIGCVSRLCALFQSVFYTVTCRCSLAGKSGGAFWSGYVLINHGTFNATGKQWKLLEHVDFTRSFTLHSEDWEETLRKCPETFQYAPQEIRSNPEMITLAVGRNAAMLRFAKSVGVDLLRDLLERNPRIVLFLNENQNDILQVPELERRDPYHIVNLEHEQMQYVISACEDQWKQRLKAAPPRDRFLYLKSKDIGSPHTIQVFKDKMWIHMHNGYIGRGTSKKVKAVVDWRTGKQYAKLSILTKGNGVNLDGDNVLSKEIRFFDMLKGKRGIVQLVDTFAYPSKCKLSQPLKRVLIEERYHYDFKGITKDVLAKWNEEDLLRFTLDLLHGIKAYKENNIVDEDLNDGNIMVQLDEEGHLIKAGFTDFEQAIVETEASKKKFMDPLYPEYHLQSEILSYICGCYQTKDMPVPDILVQGIYKSKYDALGWRIIGLDYVKRYEDAIADLDKEKDKEAIADRVEENYNAYRSEFVQMPTKSVDEMIEETQRRLWFVQAEIV